MSKSKYHPYYQRFKTDSERFWEKVDRSGECWEWTAYRDKDGYGTFKLNNYQHQAHRAALILSGITLPDDVVVCHSCDNPSCVKPDHLFVGSQSDNSEDMVKKGRSLVGEKHPRSKLTEDDVRCIRRCRGQITGRRLAEIFGVHVGRIYNIHAGREWGHV